ncbi:hypothetical protein GCM10023068_11050 [Leifsonia shinshuensis]
MPRLLDTRSGCDSAAAEHLDLRVHGQIVRALIVCALTIGSTRTASSFRVRRSPALRLREADSETREPDIDLDFGLPNVEAST